MNENNKSTGPKESFAIYHDLMVKAPLKKVFDAIAEPEHLVNWWPLKCTGNPIMGGEYNFYFAPEYDWYGKVIQYKNNSTFHIKMTNSDADWNPTTFGFDLENANESVQIKFWHKGWPACNSHYRRSSFCWAMLLKGLKNYVERGAIIPFEERE